MVAWFKHILKIQAKGLADKIDVEYKGKRTIKNYANESDIKLRFFKTWKIRRIIW